MDTSGTYPVLGSGDPLYQIAEYTRRMSTALDSVYPPTPETRPVIIDNAVGRTARAWDAANSRYQMIYGDTGQRNIGPWSGLTVRIRRTNNIISFTAYGVISGSGDIDAGSVPAGFRPEANQVISCFDATGLLRVLQIYYSPYPLRIYGVPNVPTYLNMSGSWATSDPWPTSLPGTAVGSIPA